MASSNTVIILPGDFPDPTIVRLNDDYYLTHSANVYAPSLLIWHSTDLQRWSPIGHALNTYDGDIWAPDISYHDGMFYIYYTTSGRNKVITADRPEGPWSEPVDLNVPHIDPGHIVDSDGRRYLYLSGGNVIELASNGLSTIGDIKHVYSGWPVPSSWRIEATAEEGPKLFWRNGWCYLVTAQGGTAGPSTGHMAVVARSRSALGPWKNCPDNPILRTFSRNERWWCKGHATILETAEGEWRIVYHAYDNGYVTLGRHTLLQTIKWTDDDWPYVDDSAELPVPFALPELSDNFEGTALKWQWRFASVLDHSRYETGNGVLKLQGLGESAGSSSPLCLLPRDHSYQVTVDVVVVSASAEAGILLFYNENFYTGLGLIPQTGVILRHHHHREPVLQQPTTKAKLRIVNDEHETDFFVKLEGSEWTRIPRGFDVSGWNHNTICGFLGLRVALYAAGSGEAQFRNFTYEALHK